MAMLLWILLLLLTLFGLGFPILILWYVAVVLVAVWILSFAVRGGGRSAHSRR
ncbi:hydrophobic protein [Streptomyces sp. NPDC006208]|uniref:hydrophobic protein n=1 Tax=Streptomyces sp. NPDC006208 TaxID=3156734 RepID=UPI0033A4468E